MFNISDYNMFDLLTPAEYDELMEDMNKPMDDELKGEE